VYDFAFSLIFRAMKKSSGQGLGLEAHLTETKEHAGSEVQLRQYWMEAPKDAEFAGPRSVEKADWTSEGLSESEQTN
jgi:hypothetical protein